MQIIGQTEILNFLDNYAISRFHKPILMVGSQGCGKHFFTAYLANKLGVEVEEITDTISSELIDNINVSALPKLFLFDISKVAMVKKLNTMLKFLEEPSIHYIVLLAESHQQVSLPTIENRCFIINFKPYSKLELVQIASNYNIPKKYVDYCSVPGQLINYNVELQETINKLGNRIVKGLRGVNLPKFLKIKDKFNLDHNSKNKIDIKYFMRFMTSLWLNNPTDENIKCCQITSKYSSLMLDSRLNFDMLLGNYLVDIWGVYN